MYATTWRHLQYDVSFWDTTSNGKGDEVEQSWEKNTTILNTCLWLSIIVCNVTCASSSITFTLSILWYYRFEMSLFSLWMDEMKEDNLKTKSDSTKSNYFISSTTIQWTCKDLPHVHIAIWLLKRTLMQYLAKVPKKTTIFENFKNVI